MGSLAQVLRELPTSSDANLLISPAGFDDAGVYRLREDLALVQTVDFFPPLVDDPFAFGTIAAANSLSDVYAMGARPVACLNIVGFPDDRLPIEVLGEILKGGAAKVHEAGAVLAGGHTVRDAEIKYGLAVSGIVDPQRIVANSGSQPGDVLILTKPIGSGNLTTAFKKGKLTEQELGPCIRIMSDLNRSASEAMLEVGVHAATDITGFGLIGHAHEMAAASEVTLFIEARKVPLMAETLRFAGKKMFTRAVDSNLAHVGAGLDRAGVDELLVRVLAEAQTSGGLLISVPAGHVNDLVGQLQERGTWAHDVIGEVGPAGSHTLVLRG